MTLDFILEDFEIKVLKFVTVKQQKVKIICPYLTLNILDKIIAQQDWILITDIGAWYKSTPEGERSKVVDFIKTNIDKIRHIDKVHAKAIILKDKALFGSSNFTTSGLHNNIELSAIIDDQTKVNELNTWFDNLLKNTNPLTNDKIDSIIDSIPLILYQINNNNFKEVSFYSEDDYFINLVPDTDFKKSSGLNFNKVPQNLFFGKKPEKIKTSQIWNKKEVIITNKEVKIIDFKNLDINNYMLFKNTKEYIYNMPNNIHPATPIILGALLGFYKLVARKNVKHEFYILKEEVENINKLKNLGFTYSSEKISFDKSKINLKKLDLLKLELLVRRYYQLYTNNSILSNPTYDKDDIGTSISCLFDFWLNSMN